MSKHLRPHRIFLLLAALLLILPVSAARAQEGGADQGRTGSVRLVFVDAEGNKITYQEGQQINLYLVGTVSSTDGESHYDTTAGDFAGWRNASRLARMTSESIAENSANISAMLASYVMRSNPQPRMTATVTSGEMTFSPLPVGLYFVYATPPDGHEADAMTPFIVAIPDQDGLYDIVARPKHDGINPNDVDIPDEPEPENPDNPNKPSGGDNSDNKPNDSGNSDNKPSTSDNSDNHTSTSSEIPSSPNTNTTSTIGGTGTGTSTSSSTSTSTSSTIGGTGTTIAPAARTADTSMSFESLAGVAVAGLVAAGAGIAVGGKRVKG